MIDKNKQYRTRGGLPVRIYATDCNGDYPVHGSLLKDGIWYLCGWTDEGKSSTDTDAEFVTDLIEVDCEEGEGL